MRLFFGALVLNFMVFFKEIEASDFRRILPKPSRNDRQGVANQAQYSGGQQPYYPQSFYPQTPGYQTHSQESFHQESSPEASGLRRIKTRPYVNDREGIDHLVTSRHPTQSFSTHDPPVQANQYLDLNEPPPHSPESFDQQIHGYHFYPQQPLRQLNPAETSHLVYKYNFRNGRLPDPVDYQEPEYSQEYSKLGNVEWLVGQTREAEFEALYAQSKDEEAGRLVHDGSMSLNKNLLRHKRRLAKQLIEQKIIQEELEKKPRALRFREPNPSHNTGEASTVNPHATRGSGHRDKGKAPSRKGVSDSRFKTEAAGGGNVLDSHDPFIHQSQSSEHHFQNSYPVPIPSHMSAFNPYIRHPPNDPNDPQHWNYPGGSGSNYKR